MKEEQNQRTRVNPNASKTQEEVKQGETRQQDRVQAKAQKTAPSSGWKRLMAKKWVFPAVYMAAAAIILSLMWAFQNNNSNTLTEGELGLNVEQTASDENSTPTDEALPVTVPAETMQWPVMNPEEVQVIRPFYDMEGSSEAKQAAMIRYENTFMPSMGISLARQDNATFDVLAARSGTVTRVEELPLVGHLVEIEHEDGLKTIYSSLSNIVVEPDSEVNQGEVIAQAGRSEIGKDLGVHLHFEVHKEGEPVNPQELLPEPRS